MLFLWVIQGNFRESPCCRLDYPDSLHLLQFFPYNYTKPHRDLARNLCLVHSLYSVSEQRKHYFADILSSVQVTNRKQTWQFQIILTRVKKHSNFQKPQYSLCASTGCCLLAKLTRYSTDVTIACCTTAPHKEVRYSKLHYQYHLDLMGHKNSEDKNPSSS